MSDTKNHVLNEAHELVHGAREEAYSHPADDFARVATMLNGLLAHKLRVPLTALDWPLIMIVCKLARQAHKYGHDNLVDIAGYAECAARVNEREPKTPWKLSGEGGIDNPPRPVVQSPNSAVPDPCDPAGLQNLRPAGFQNMRRHGRNKWD